MGMKGKLLHDLMLRLEQLLIFSLALILVGGFGTRLRPLVRSTPSANAPSYTELWDTGKTYH